MTNKEIVLRRHPGAFAFSYRYNDPSSRWFVYKLKPIRRIGQGKTPRQAWASAAETVRRGK